MEEIGAHVTGDPLGDRRREAAIDVVHAELHSDGEHVAREQRRHEVEAPTHQDAVDEQLQQPEQHAADQGAREDQPGAEEHPRAD